jgi:UTP-glucose-1-phosphate uridylyltransferase
VFELLGNKIENGNDGNEEYELTSVLKEVCLTDGMTGYRVDGCRYDIGIPSAYRDTIARFGKGGACL